MNRKQRFQQELRDAMRAHDQSRVNVIRMVLAALEKAQETMGKQAFASFQSEWAPIQPDRHQILSEQAIQDILRNELQLRREAVELLYAGGQKKRAELEESEIGILEQYLTTI